MSHIDSYVDGFQVEIDQNREAGSAAIEGSLHSLSQLFLTHVVL